MSFADAVRDSVYALNPYVGVTRAESELFRVSEIVDRFGWEAAKTAPDGEVRRLLQVMGTEVGRMLFGNNVWVDIADRKIQAIEGPVVITDVRFENEAEYVRGMGGQVVWVYRSGIGPVNAHASDNIDFATDVILPNDGTIEDLYNQIDVLVS